MKRNLLLLSNSIIHGSEFLEWAYDFLNEFLHRLNVKQVLFVPYALKDHNKYADTVHKALNKIGIQVNSIHTFENPITALEEAQAVFIGGGNTFRLLKTLYDNNLITVLKRKILQDGVPYIGSSAGTNVSTASICTTNDMPIVFPPTFDGLGLVPFNINPHYIDPEPNSKHMGESRETRIKQYHEECDTAVLGLREGSLLVVSDEVIKLQGKFPARLFVKGEEPKEYPVGSDLSFLLKI